MKIRDITVLLLAAGFIFGAVTAYAGPAASLPEDAGLTRFQAAEDGLYAFLELLPRIQQEDGEFGFAESDPLDGVYLDDPYRLYRLDSRALAEYRECDTALSLISASQTWYYPVMLGDQTRAVLIVDKMNGRWRAVGFGYTNLAPRIGKIRQNWPASEGYNPLLIASPGREYLYSVPEKGAYNLTSLLRSEEKKGFKNSSVLSNLSDEVGRLKSVVRDKSLKPEVGIASDTGLADPVAAMTSTVGPLDGPIGMASLPVNFHAIYPGKVNWSGHACAQAVLEYYGVAKTQQEISVFALGGTRDSVIHLEYDGPTNPGISGVLTEFANLQPQYSNYWYYPFYAWQLINSDIPFIIQWYEPGGQPLYHAVVAYGYVHVDPNMCAFCPNPNEPMLALMDPKLGQSLEAYSWIVDGPDHVWIESLSAN